MGLSRGCYEAEMVNHSFNIQQIHTEYLLCVGCILDTGDKVVTKNKQKTLRFYSHIFFFCNLRVLNEINILCGIFIVNSAIITQEAKAP